MIFTLSVVGTYSLNQSMLDVWILLAFGVIGFSVVPVVIGLILGSLVEETLKQSLVIFDSNLLMFLTRPLACLFFALAALALIMSTIRVRRG